MVNSDFVFEESTPIAVGTHGDHSFVFDEGDPVEDSGGSKFVFEAGVGLRGLEGWAFYKVANSASGDPSEMNDSVSIGGSPYVDISHDGSTTSSYIFLVVYRKNALPSPPWEITYLDFAYTFNQTDAENNFAAGFYAENSGRPNDNRQIASAAYEIKESGTTPRNYFTFEDGSGSENSKELSLVDWSVQHDITVGFTGSEAYLKIDGSELARLAGPNKTYYPFFSLEDDPNTTVGEQVTVETIHAPEA